MARGRVIKALAVDADDSTETDANAPLDRMPLPTLDERANFYLRAVYGERRFSNEEYLGARDLMLRAMANDINARSNGRSPDEASLPLGEQHEASLPLGEQHDASLSLAEQHDASLSVGVQHNGLTAFDDTSLQLEASKQPAGGSRDPEPEAIAQEPGAFSPRLPLFSALPRMAAICGAAAVAAVAGYWAAGITARFVPNTAPHGAALTVQVAPPDPSPGSPSNPRIVAEAQRELQSALNTAQLSPDEIATLVKRGQEF